MLVSSANSQPVSSLLIRDLQEDVFMLDILCPDSSVKLALTRLTPCSSVHSATAKIPVVLVHGSFCNRHFWYSSNAHGFAAWLVRQGYEVWIPEMRGHGLSVKNNQYKNNTVSAYVRFDLPQIAQFIYQQNPQAAYWIGHSLGGICLAALLAEQRIASSWFRGVALIGAQVSYFKPWMKLPFAWLFVRSLMSNSQYWQAGLTAQGVDREPLGVVSEFLRWYSLTGSFRAKDCNWWKALKQVKTPLLCLAGEADKGDPVKGCFKLFQQFASHNKRFVHLAKKNDFLCDYDHLSMLIGRHAKKEVWPLLALWMAEITGKSA